MRLDSPNANGDVFPSNVLPSIKNQYFGHIELKNKKTSQVSHKVTNIQTLEDENGKYLVGDVMILDTSAGIVLKEAIRTGRSMSLEPRITASIEDGIIKPPISIVSFDMIEP